MVGIAHPICLRSIIDSLMVSIQDFKGLINKRFFNNFFPIPATSPLKRGMNVPDFQLPNVTNNSQVKLSDYFNQQPVILAFTRIFSEKLYCPLCYPHIIELNGAYEQFRSAGVEVLLITSTDHQQSLQVVQDLGLTMPFLCDPDCRVFRSYGVGQALGAPLPAQFVLDLQGRIKYRHLFSFFSPNADADKLLTAVG